MARKKQERGEVPLSKKGWGHSLKSRGTEKARKRRKLDELVRDAVTEIARFVKQAIKRLWASTKLFVIRNKVIIRAWAIFLLWIGIFATLLLAMNGQVIDPPLMVAVARSTAFILNFFGTKAWVEGFTIYSPNFSVEVIPACTGLLPTLLFLTAVFAYPCKLKEKALGIGIAIPAIFLVNLVRMVRLFYIGLYLPGVFEQAHLLIWQPLMIFAAVALWLLWVGRFTHAMAR
jgi:exosortase H (IPTLxxWG-CTERM-specific)